ncbi:hypothetical protein SAMN05444672_1651 [Bacillus sp. OK838]|nr:hypothetical protein SAMN05444672_1651 [Bacillus sp. OK838]
MVSGKAIFHPCQKPVAVLEKIIATHTYPPMIIKKIKILSKSENLMPIHLKFIFFHGFLPFPSLL